MSNSKKDPTVVGSWAGFAVGFVLVGAWTIAAALMLISFGAWGWVIWPAAAVFFLNRTFKSLGTVLKQIAKSKDTDLNGLAELLAKHR
jgi:hypothetical protein